MEETHPAGLSVYPSAVLTHFFNMKNRNP